MLGERLCQIGFTKKESNIYLELLKIGPQAVSVIAKRVGLNRSSTYSILKSLIKKGVLSYHKNNRVQYFSANDPNCLIGYVDRKCQTYDYYRNEILNIVPKFRDLKGNFTFKAPVISYFEGIEGVKHVMHDALTANEEFLSFIPLDKWLSFGLKDFLLEYKDFKMMNNKIKLKVIVPDNNDVKIFFNENYSDFPELTEILYLKDFFGSDIFENQVNVYNDKVAIIQLESGKEYAVIIQSKDIHLMHRMFFELCWKKDKDELKMKKE
ncbi:MAG: helix-turn-helix domain-containing protein [Candidatus Gracilibacteria bacterium]